MDIKDAEQAVMRAQYLANRLNGHHVAGLLDRFETRELSACIETLRQALSRPAVPEGWLPLPVKSFAVISEDEDVIDEVDTDLAAAISMLDIAEDEQPDKAWSLVATIDRSRLAAAPEPAQANDGWIEWHGGEQPVADDVRVRVRFRDGSEDVDRAGVYDWQHDMEDCDIVAYRVVGDDE